MAAMEWASASPTMLRLGEDRIVVAYVGDEQIWADETPPA